MIEVAVPAVKMTDTVSSASSLSPPSVDSVSREDSVLDTPATSVAVSPPASDNGGKTRKRVSASTRAQQLRASTFALPSSTGSTRTKRTASQMLATETSDAALARELQLEEYGGSNAKRQRNTSDVERIIAQESDDELWPEFEEQMSPQPSRRRSLRSRPRFQIKDDVDLPMLDDGDDTDDADDYAYSPSDDNASEADAASPEVGEEEEEEVPVIAPSTTRRTRTSNTPRRGRVSAAARRQRAAEPVLPYTMGRRVRDDDLQCDWIASLTSSRQRKNVESLRNSTR